MLQPIFEQLIQRCTSDESLARQLWAEIEKHYQLKGRHYHTMLHIQNMYNQLLAIKEQIKDWDTLLFTLFYHDIIYSATRKDNEERSAALAAKRLQQINFPASNIKQCIQQILATKNHTVSLDEDTNFLTDSDLSILGAGWPEYEQYTKAIRKEYAIYPDLLYKPGRRKVLQHFLSMQPIYKTQHFYMLYEEAAKHNIKKELLLL